MTYEEAEALIREHMDYGGNVKVAALAKALSTSKLTFHEAAVAALEAATKSLNAAGASEGQAEPVAWAVYWGIGNMRPNSVHFEKETAVKVASEIKSHTELRPLYTNPSAEIAALRERIAGMEKDAERYRFLREQDDSCEVFCMYGRNGPWGECGHMDIYGVLLDATIDAAIAKEKQS